MKKTAKLSAAFMLSVMIALSISTYSQNPTYSCVLQNDTLLSSTVFQFDVYIYRTGSLDLYLNNYQFSFNIINTRVILHGGKLSAHYIPGSSQLPKQSIPGGIVILAGKNNLIRINGLQPNSIGTLIPASGLKFGTFQVTNTESYGQKPDLVWWNTVPGVTILYAIVPPAFKGAPVNITDFASHTAK